MEERTRRLTTSEVAERAGVHRDTLLRWLRQGAIPEPGRDRHGWRLFTEQEAASVVTFASAGDHPMPSVVKEPPARYALGEVSRLAQIDWDFVGANTTYLTHGMHPYPAKFIPQIPNALIQELSTVGETVLDIFCGSGTTLVEALLLKRHAIGIDANPLARLVSEAKTTRLEDGDELELQSLVQRALEYSARAIACREGTLFHEEPFLSCAARPESKALSFWFEAHVIEELAEVLSWCRDLKTSQARLIALAAFSAIIVAVSKQDSDTRYVRRDKGIRPGDVFKRFARSLTDATHAATEFTALVESRFHCTVVHADVLAHPDIGKVDLVVCSPPYPNAYSYHLYHMTRMLWLGMDQPGFKRAEIGSHRKYSSRGANRATEETFRAEFASIFGWLRSGLKPGRYACFVVGDSTIRGRTINNAGLIADAGSVQGFREIARIERTLQSTRKAFNPAIGKIKTEHILILQNGAR